MQKFTIHTVVDITETKVYRNNPNLLQQARQQQQNFDTFMQILGLRANIYYDKSPIRIENTDVSQYDLGTSIITQKQTIWQFEFSVEYDGAFAQEEDQTAGLINDFDLVPIITALDETARINNNVFLTTDKKYKNICFKIHT